MAEKIYVCPIIGRGTESDPYRAAVADAADVERVTSAINSNPDGTPVYPWTICRVRTNNFAAVDAIDKALSLGAKNDPDSPSQANWALLRAKMIVLGYDPGPPQGNKTLADLQLELIKEHYPHVNTINEAFS